MSEAERYDVTQYERPSVTVDVVIFSVVEGELKVLLIRRRNWPFEGMWAINSDNLWRHSAASSVQHLGQAMDAELWCNSAAWAAIVALCPIS